MGFRQDGLMNEWWIEVYGDPCRECDFNWSQSPTGVVASVEELPSLFDAVLAGTSGRQRHPELSWSAKAYVFHVADNLRIWAERLEGIRSGAPPQVAAYDENHLASVRRYEEMPVEAALWSVRTAAAAWSEAMRAAIQSGTVVDHPERGELTASEVV
ncbi:MAG: hypothetical protein ABIQ39_11300, partial [Ilumatobacteraceae bacterium]